MIIPSRDAAAVLAMREYLEAIAIGAGASEEAVKFFITGVLSGAELALAEPKLLVQLVRDHDRSSADNMRAYGQQRRRREDAIAEFIGFMMTRVEELMARDNHD